MQNHKFEVDETSNKKRLDVFLSNCLPDISRSRLKKLIEDDRVKVNSKSRPAGYKIRTKEKVEIEKDSAEILFKLINKLEENDDVQSVFSNFEVSDEIMNQLIN